MARPTRLKILGERPVSLPDADPDVRTVSEAFGPGSNGSAPPPPVPDSALAEDVLAILRQSHERMQGAVTQAATIATQAVERAQVAEKLAYETAERQTKTAEVAQIAADQASSALAAGVKQAAGAAARQAGLVLLNLVTFLVDRAPALFALAGGWLLWRETLIEPNVLKLIGLGLYGACVVAPSAWLSARR